MKWCSTVARRWPVPAHLLANAVQTWTNTDAHYPLARGLVCRACPPFAGLALHSPQAS
ncbi:MAG: hypothetical protein IPF55_10620 [Rhodoferax sp.]|nr:hypothetical protein [Rhodoferax sp.]